MGFTFDNEGATKGVAESLADMQRLIENDPRNGERVFPYIGGEEVGNDPNHEHCRYAIDFFDQPLERDERLGAWSKLSEADQRACLTRGSRFYYPNSCAEDWPALLSIVRQRVKPERDVQKRQALRERWWQYAEKRPGLYGAIANLEFILATTRVSPHFLVSVLPAGMIYSEQLIVFPYERKAPFCCLQSRTHEIWARSFASSMKDDLRYAPSDAS